MTRAARSGHNAGMRLTDYKVLTFDCYGTLIDWETGIWDALQPLIVASGEDHLPRDVLLAMYGRYEHDLQQSVPQANYAQVLARVHASMAAELGVRGREDLDEAFAHSVPLWPAFADTADALRSLKRHFRLVILSNVHRDGFTASNRKLGVEFDAIYTAEDIGSYKPSQRNFEYLLAHLQQDLGLGPDDVLHTAQSLFHDHVPAKAMGLANAWIDRQRLSTGGSQGATSPVAEPPVTDFVFFSLGEMADAVSAETR